MLRGVCFTLDFARHGLTAALWGPYMGLDPDVIRLDFVIHRSLASQPPEKLWAIRQRGGRVFEAPPLRALSMPGYCRWLDGFFSAHAGYDFLHGHLPNAAAFYLSAARRHGVPVRIQHSHNTRDGASGPSRLRNRLLRYPLRRGMTHPLACSRAAGLYLFGPRLAADMELYKNAIDAEEFGLDPAARAAVRSALGLEGAFVVGHVGRMERQKNHAFLFDVFRRIHERQDNAVLLLAGDGALAADLRRRAARMGLGDAVRFLGDRPDVGRLYQAMDVFCLPSRHEGFPLALLEAQASGLPCLVSDVVPKEARLIDAALWLPPRGAARWAEEALRLRSLARRDAREVIRRAGHDVRDQSRWLQAYYLRACQRTDCMRSPDTRMAMGGRA